MWVYNKEHLEIDIMEVVLIIVTAGVVVAHIDSVRAQVKRLAKKEYTKYLP